MTIIEKYGNLNSKEVIQQLMDEISKISGAMNPKVRENIVLKINKAKLQMWFASEYPESKFTCPGSYIPMEKSEVSHATTPTGQDGQAKTEAPVDFSERFIDYLPHSTQDSQKHVYGTYIEMAFHNMFLTFNHIYSLVFGEDLLEKGKETYEKKPQIFPNGDIKPYDSDFASAQYIWSPMFERMRDAQPEEKERLNALLDKHFPLLKAIEGLKEDKRKSKLETLEICSKVLRELRNCYSHYLFVPSEQQEKTYKRNIPYIYELLNVLYDGSKREVKTRFGFSDEKMKCAEKFEPNHDRSIRDSYGKPKKVVPRKNFQYHIKDNAGVITPFGLTFLASLFLEKKYSKILADKTHCIKYADQSVMCELISVYRIRLHVQKLNVTKSTDALALDIINELQRCPKQLFENLPIDEQQKFRVKPATDQDPEVLMVRHSDRFAHLLLKYIDDARLFQRIRFQVSLGKYFFRFYEKVCIDTTTAKRVRTISKDVHGFGRLSQIEDYRKSVWGDMIREYDDVHVNTIHEQPYVTDHRAQYLLNNNKVGLYLLQDGDNKCILPELTPEGVRNIAPTCWLSTYELPALGFLLHLYNGDASRIEELISSTVGKYTRLFSDVRDGKILPVGSEEEFAKLLQDYGNLRPQDIPEKLREYLLMKEVDVQQMFNERARSTLISMIDESKRRLERIEEDLRAARNVKQNKFGKKSFVSIKPGKIADYLAHDMMMFQPEIADENNKLTGLNFRILQSVLALYDGNLEELSQVLRNAHIIGNANDERCNPIVMAVLRKNRFFNSITYFYKSYLKERKNYLEDCLKAEQFTQLSFLHANQVQWQERTQEYYQKLASRYLTDEYGGVASPKPIELPRGIFDSYIRKKLLEIQSMRDLACDKTKNISYLIYGYFKNVMQDDSQPFYEASRNYRLFNVLYRKSPRDPKSYFKTAEIREMLNRNSCKSIYKDIDSYLSRTLDADRENERQRCTALLRLLKESETELKRYRIQDILLFLFAKRLLLDSKADEKKSVEMAAINKIMLKEITNGETLSQKISISIQVSSQKGRVKTLRQDGLKLKNYSQFYAILNDRRLPSLLDLVCDDDIPRPDLEKELDTYDKVHPSVLGTVFDFEKNYHSKHESDFIPDLNTMLDNTNMQEKKKKEIRKIRNSFAHLTYPRQRDTDASNVALPKKAESISNRLIDELNAQK